MIVRTSYHYGRRLLGLGAALSCGMVFKSGIARDALKKQHVRADEVDIGAIDEYSLKLQIEADKELTWQRMSMRSSISVSGSVSALVEITMSRWIEHETLYHKYMQTLTDLLAKYIRTIGTPEAEELWSTLMYTRGYLAEIKEERMQIELLWTNCKMLSEHAGQAAFHTGADFSACRLGEVVSSAKLQMTRLATLSTALELHLATLDAEEIRASTRHQREVEGGRGKSSRSHPNEATEESRDPTVSEESRDPTVSEESRDPTVSEEDGNA